MRLKTTYTIHLDVNEAAALKTLLGSMNDEEFSRVGIKGEDREVMSNLYDLIPHSDEDE